MQQLEAAALVSIDSNTNELPVLLDRCRGLAESKLYSLYFRVLIHIVRNNKMTYLRYFYGRLCLMPPDDERWILILQELIDHDEPDIIHWIMRKVSNYIPLYSLRVTKSTYRYFLRYPGLVRLDEE